MAAGYMLAIARDETMKNAVRTFNASGTGISTDTLEKGEYFWKVTALGKFGSTSVTGESGVRRLILTHREIVNPPELIFPTNDKKFSLKL